MKRGLIVLILAQLSFVHYGQIIADHTVVDKYDDIPQYYINEVKKMMICFAGESHSVALRTGMTLLEALDPTYACNVATAEGYTDQHVRVEDNGWWSERWWVTGASNTMKNDLTSYHNNGHPFRVLGFGWCSDMLGPGASATADPEYGVKWYGRSDGGPQGSLPWGLDAGDYAITGNSVNLQTYFDAIDEYIAFCETNSPTTTMVYTTGPVNSTSGWEGEPGYQGHIKHEAIRDHVNADPTRVLFDYADILCYDDDGSGATTSWDGHTYPTATSANSWPEEVGHISNAGAIRLAKAQWWLLARIAGWDGGITNMEIWNPPGIKFYPNPSQGDIFIDADFANIDIVQIIGIDGSIIQEINPEPTTSLIGVNLSHNPPGKYYIKLFSDLLSHVGQVILVR